MAAQDEFDCEFRYFCVGLRRALLGTFFGSRLPKHHLSEENKEIALVGTLTGMALGLLIGSAKSYYDTQGNELTQVSANDILWIGPL